MEPVGVYFVWMVNRANNIKNIDHPLFKGRFLRTLTSVAQTF